ncbi:MAG TPA: hypothetical protein VFX98_19515, partial [Longimicrobiaceae bacterium]|nr:hypothetical protein [Longimicrobiaceae bacterium]
LGISHGPEGLRTAWEVGLGALGLGGRVELRVSPRGDRVAVFAPGDRGGLRVLDARTGRELARTREAPLDAAFGVGGRLFLLGERELRVAR